MKTIPVQTKNRLLKELGLRNMSEKDQEESLHIIGNIIFQSVVLKVFESLDHRRRVILEALLTSGSVDESTVILFLKKNAENISSIIAEELTKLKEELYRLERHVTA